MPRGFKVDSAATAEAGFRHYRSFVSMPKVTPHTNGEALMHLVLHGLDDKAPIRIEIFKRNREANGGVNRCVKCGLRVFEAPRDDINPLAQRGEWHHVFNRPGWRCDCPENGEVRCPKCHGEEHPKPMFGVREAANS